jgi:thiol-disulfide isomerase/thioredoxin
MSKPTSAALVILAILTLVAAIIASWNVPDSFHGFPGSSVTTSATGTTSDLPVLADKMPEFAGITQWWNTPDGAPLTPAKLKGQVVLVDFWTYSCVNCIRTYPFLKTMYDRYAQDGLTIVGVHTPEFAFEADPKNVGNEIVKNGLKYPVALDPKYGTWNAYNNSYWPAEYLFDRQGRLRRTHFGEGEYDQSEAAIRSLLTEGSVALPPAGPAVPTPDFSNIKTGETYFGLGRGDAFMGVPGDVGVDATYQIAARPEPDRWTVGGTWQFQPEYVQADSASAVFRFSVQANALHLVLSSVDGSDKQIEISIDGGAPRKMTINSPTLYTVATFSDGGRHVVQVKILDVGLRFYAATFS